VPQSNECVVAALLTVEGKRMYQRGLNLHAPVLPVFTPTLQIIGQVGGVL
jgi:hypothetical protein